VTRSQLLNTQTRHDACKSERDNTVLYRILKEFIIIKARSSINHQMADSPREKGNFILSS